MFNRKFLLKNFKFLLQYLYYSSFDIMMVKTKRNEPNILAIDILYISMNRTFTDLLSKGIHTHYNARDEEIIRGR